MKIIFLLKITLVIFSFSLLTSCGFVPKSNLKKSIEKPPTIFEPAYYQDLGKNIKRLHHLMQGTFTAHKEGTSKKLESWNVSEGDSVILYNVPLGNIEKEGYWIYSYEFMTSLPNQPIYTSIKQINQVSRDTLEVLYYKTKKPITLKLREVIDQSILNEKIQLDELVLRNKKVVYVKQSASQFVGYSKRYKDPQFDCLRQNKYDLSPNFYKVESAFFDKENHHELLLDKRPNLLVRRAIDFGILYKLAIE